MAVCCSHDFFLELQRHAKRLARSGQIKEIAGAFLRPRRELTFEESMQTYEVGVSKFQGTCHKSPEALSNNTCSGSQVLAEILQQGARIDDPDAAARQEFVRCVRVCSPEVYSCAHVGGLCFCESVLQHGLSANSRNHLGARWCGKVPADLVCLPACCKVVSAIWCSRQRASFISAWQA